MSLALMSQCTLGTLPLRKRKRGETFAHYSWEANGTIVSGSFIRKGRKKEK